MQGKQSHSVCQCLVTLTRVENSSKVWKS